MTEYFSKFIDEPETIAQKITLKPDDEPGTVYPVSATVVVQEKDTGLPVLNLVLYCENASPFQFTDVINGMVLVGFGNAFAFYNMLTQSRKLILLDWYFSSYAINDDHIFVCSASDITCMSFRGDIVWRSAGIAVDGVIIDAVNHTTLTCSCESDPPGGWKTREIDLLTGKVL